jgi:hypothetical protein
MFIEPRARSRDTTRTTRVFGPVGALDEIRADRALGELAGVDMPAAMYAMYVRGIGGSTAYLE